MFVSTNRTPVQLVAGEEVAGPEALAFAEHVVLLCLEPGELRLALSQRAQVIGDESADGAAAFGGTHPGDPVDLVRDGYREILHGITVTQFRSPQSKREYRPARDCDLPAGRAAGERSRAAPAAPSSAAVAGAG